MRSCGGDPLEHGGDLRDRRAAEVEAVAAVGDRRQHLLDLRRGQHEDRVRRRLLERLEERVPRRRGQHVRLVEDVDLVAAGDRRVGDALAQVADVVDRVVGRGVHLDHVEAGRAGDRHGTTRTSRRASSSARARSSGTRRGSSPSTSCPSRGSRRTGRRGGPCPARSRCAACAPRAPARPRRRRCAGGGGGTARPSVERKSMKWTVHPPSRRVLRRIRRPSAPAGQPRCACR